MRLTNSMVILTGVTNGVGWMVAEQIAAGDETSSFNGAALTADNGPWAERLGGPEC